MSSVHHWDDRPRGLVEARRVLAPGGRLLLAERRVKDGARGLSAHGLTAEQEVQLLLEMKAAGFGNLLVESRGTGGKAFVVVLGTVPLLAPDQRAPARAADSLSADEHGR
jgi:ubiquinone/menaquinone biosynthesis C-methylase UbiE